MILAVPLQAASSAPVLSGWWRKSASAKLAPLPRARSRGSPATAGTCSNLIEMCRVVDTVLTIVGPPSSRAAGSFIMNWLAVRILPAQPSGPCCIEVLDPEASEESKNEYRTKGSAWMSQVVNCLHSGAHPSGPSGSHHFCSVDPCERTVGKFMGLASAAAALQSLWRRLWW